MLPPLEVCSLRAREDIGKVDQGREDGTTLSYPLCQGYGLRGVRTDCVCLSRLLVLPSQTFATSLAIFGYTFPLLGPEFA